MYVCCLLENNCLLVTLIMLHMFNKIKHLTCALLTLDALCALGWL